MANPVTESPEIALQNVPVWPIAIPVLLGLTAIYFLLPRGKKGLGLFGGLLGGAALVTLGFLLLWGATASAETVLFYSFAGIAVLGGALLITQVNPVHAALSFALVVLSTCGLFLLQAAPFLMAATIIVYAGAIVVTFLFVIMLAQQAGPSNADQRTREAFLAVIGGFGLLATLLYLINWNYDTRTLDRLLQRTQTAADSDSVEEISNALGDEKIFFDEFKQVAEASRGSPDRPMLEDLIVRLRIYWDEWKKKKDLAAMKRELAQLYKTGSRVESRYGSLEPHGDTQEHMSAFSQYPRSQVTPGENVAPLGRSLFSDYLIAVELGGTLLLVATIGAIVIVQHRPEVPR